MPNPKISEFDYNGNTYDFKDKDAQYTDIDYEDWLELTPTQQESGKYYIHGMPESKQKIVTDSGTFTDASQNTYTGVTTDMISYDATNNQLLLKVGGADSVIPFSRGGGAELFDINPTQSEDALYGYMYVVKGTTKYSCYPICGYDKVSLKTVGGGVYQSPSYCFIMNNGTETTPVTYQRNTWTDFVQVPDGAIALKVIVNYLSAATTSPAPITVYYSMLTKDSPYNV